MSKEEKVVSLSAIGLDSPGLVAKITARIRQMKGNIIDVEENCRRGLFSIFLIIDFSASPSPIREITAALKDIEDETALKIVVGIYHEEQIRHPQKKEIHLVTVLGPDRRGIIAGISNFFLENNINIEHCRMIARGDFFSMEMTIDSRNIMIKKALSHEEAVENMKSELKGLCKKMNQSVVIQSEDVYKKMKKLVVFDVESTFIQEASLRNFLEKVKGSLKSLNRRVKLRDGVRDQMLGLIQNARALKGLPIRDVEKFSEILELNPGSFELIRILKYMGFKIALLSSGFNFFIKKIFEEAGVDYAFSNTLQVDHDGLITGELEEPIITSDTKEEILKFIMSVEDISRDQVIAVGDGSTRSHFIRNAGLSIAFKPEETSIKTDGILSSDQITNILYCLGIPKAELDKYL